MPTSKSTTARSGVFISYARSDGEKFANVLRQRLEAEGIPLWQTLTWKMDLIRGCKSQRRLIKLKSCAVIKCQALKPLTWLAPNVTYLPVPGWFQ